MARVCRDVSLLSGLTSHERAPHTSTMWTMRLGAGAIGLVLLAATGTLTGPAHAERPASSLNDPGAEKKPWTSDDGPKAITDPRQDVLLESEPILAAITRRYPNVAGGLEWVPETQTIRLNVVGSIEDPSSDAGRMAGEVEAAHLPAEVEFVTVPKALTALLATADSVLESTDEWAPGLRGLSYVTVSETDGVIVVGVDSRFKAEWEERAKEARFESPITIKSEAEVGVRYESRLDDFAPWTGGLARDAAYFSGPSPQESAIGCTGGFTWRRWSNAGNAASTAEHCVNYPVNGNTYLPWRNNGTLVGTPVITSPASDTALLQSPGQTYSATVFVGAANTSTLRIVQSASSTDAINENVALSGRISGGPISTVYKTNVLVDATTVTVMASDVSSSGDSGGPLASDL